MVGSNDPTIRFFDLRKLRFGPLQCVQLETRDCFLASIFVINPKSTT
jgi:hypothetical protein